MKPLPAAAAPAAAAPPAAAPPAAAPPAAAPAARRRVLVVSFSQTGQSAAVVERIASPLREAGLDLHVETLQPQPAYPFPWPFFRFLDAMPETVLLRPPALAPLALKGDEPFDLVLLAFPVWFLAPAPPMVAFLRHPLAARLLKGRPVVTVVTCRNMWLHAHEVMDRLLAGCGALRAGHVVLTDPAALAATFVTTPRWLLTGRRDAVLGLPPAGLDAAQLEGCARFGLALRDALAQGTEAGPLFAGLGAAPVDARLYASERTGAAAFGRVARLARAAGAPGAPLRLALLLAGVAVLALALVSFLPLTLVVQRLLRPVSSVRLARIRARFESPLGAQNGERRTP